MNKDRIDLFDNIKIKHSANGDIDTITIHCSALYGINITPKIGEIYSFRLKNDSSTRYMSGKLLAHGKELLFQIVEDHEPSHGQPEKVNQIIKQIRDDNFIYNDGLSSFVDECSRLVNYSQQLQQSNKYLKEEIERLRTDEENVVNERNDRVVDLKAELNELYEGNERFLIKIGSQAMQIDHLKYCLGGENCIEDAIG